MDGLKVDFATSANARGHGAIRDIMGQAVEHIVATLGAGTLRSIILTGAMTRGEGTVLERENGSLLILSDLDLYLVGAPDVDLPLLKRRSSEIACSLRTVIPEERMAAPFDLAGVSLEEIASVQPAIGTVDLRNRGRVIWGEDVLSGLAPLEPGTIPPSDAVTLILNRIVEELMHRGAGSPATVEMGVYHTAKTGADLALAILALLGEYRPTYRERADRLGEIWEDPRLKDLRRHLPDLPDRVSEWTRWKLSPDPGTLALVPGASTSQEAADELWLSLVPAVEAVWTWAMLRWTGDPSSEPLALAPRIGQMETARERFRGWKRAWRRGDVGHGLGDMLCMARGIPCGSPASLLYAAASLAYFASPGRDGLDDVAAARYLARARRLMPIPVGGDGDWDGVRRVLVDYWRRAVMRGMR